MKALAPIRLLAAFSTLALLGTSPTGFAIPTPISGAIPSITKPAAASEGWSGNLDSALARAGRDYQPVLVLFSSPGCSWCERLKSEVFPDPEVAALLRNFVRVEIDISEDQTTAAQYQVRAVPAIRILNAAGQLQNGVNGFLPAAAFQDLLKGALNPEFASKEPASVTELLKLLDSGKLTTDQWPDLLLALAEKNSRRLVHDRLLKIDPPPAKELLASLQDRRLAVRLAALEIAEEIAGDDFGFDPWAGFEANAEALEAWKKWAANGAKQSRQAPSGTLSTDQMRACLGDIISDNRDRSARALRMLQYGGNKALQALQEFGESNPQLSSAAKNRIREARYALILPSVGKKDSLALAHQLVFGNLDTKIQALSALNTAGDAGLPVAYEYLQDPEPMVREASIETLVALAGADAAPVLQDHLKGEKDENVVFAVLRAVKNIPCPKSDEILIAHLQHPNEDLAVAALEGLSKSKGSGLDQQLGPCMTDRRWRVRVAALETTGELKLLSLGDACEKALGDPDAFVRSAAVEALPKVNTRNAPKKLEELFFKDEELRPGIVKAMASLRAPLPVSFGRALESSKPETIIGVLESLATAEDHGVEIAGRFLRNPNPDISSTALRLLASGRLGSSLARTVIQNVLRGNDREKTLIALQSFKFSGDQTKQLREHFENRVRPEAAQNPGVVSSMVRAFSGATKAGCSLNDLADSVEDLFKNAKDPEIRSASALVLARGCHPQALKFLEENLPSQTSSERLLVAECFSEGANANATGLLRLLLQDSSQEVLSAAVEGCTDSNSAHVLVALPLEQLLRPGHSLQAKDLMGYHLFSSLEHRDACRAAAPIVRKMVTDADVKVSTLGLLLLQQTWSEADEPLVRPLFTSQNPWQRRAALQALGWNAPSVFQSELKKVAEDPSEEVRRLLPELMDKSSNQERLLALDEESAHTRNIYNYSSRESRKAAIITPQELELLQTLTQDPSNKVRVEAFFGLLNLQQKIDLSAFIAALNSLPDRDSFSSKLHEFFTSNYSRLGQEFAVLLPFVSESQTRYGNWSDVRKHFANSTTGKEGKADRFAFVAASKTHPTPVLASFLNTSAKPAAAAASNDPAQAQVRVVFFYTPGCPDCKRTEKMLAELKGQFANLEVELFNLREVGAMHVNEALCERFHVPAKQRSVGPALFAGGGCLIKNELNFESIKNLLAQSAGKSEDWRKLPESVLTEASSAIQQRYSTFSLGVVTAAGLLDGINPCAFATIIFLISYLQVAKRAPRQILQVGGAFVVGVFLAYFILGLGLVEIVARISLLRGAGKLMNGALSLFAFGIMVVSIRDGFLCLQGRLADTSLQLPGFLKTRIHEVIRTGARHSRFVLAAFVSGVVISFLELACTGQVYAPTILYMLKAGRAAALFYLLLYNLAFVIPLVVVFLLAYAGIRSTALIQFQTRHAALVKFATAALFLLLFLVLIWELL